MLHNSRFARQICLMTPNSIWSLDSVYRNKLLVNTLRKFIQRVESVFQRCWTVNKWSNYLWCIKTDLRKGIWYSQHTTTSRITLKSRQISNGPHSNLNRWLFETATITCSMYLDHLRITKNSLRRSLANRKSGTTIKLREAISSSCSLILILAWTS